MNTLEALAVPALAALSTLTARTLNVLPLPLIDLSDTTGWFDEDDAL